MLFALVIYFALNAQQKYLPAEQACALYNQGQEIEDYDLEMENLVERGALVKVQAGESASGSYPIIEIYDKGIEHPICRLHIEHKKLIFIDRSS